MVIEKLLPREVQFIEELNGYPTIPNYELVAERMGLRPQTIKQYAYSVLEKTGTTDKFDLVMKWRCPLFRIGLKELGIL